MADPTQITLSNGKTLVLDLDDHETFYAEFLNHFLKPFYITNNDWNKTIKESISEMDRLCAIYRLPRGKMIGGLLSHIESRLPKDISELPNLDKIEILFENIDDYVQTIQEIVLEGDSQEEIRLKVSNLVENLNLFEISELLIYYSKKCFGDKK